MGRLDVVKTGSTLGPLTPYLMVGVLIFFFPFNFLNAIILGAGNIFVGLGNLIISFFVALINFLMGGIVGILNWLIGLINSPIVFLKSWTLGPYTIGPYTIGPYGTPEIIPEITIVPLLTVVPSITPFGSLSTILDVGPWVITGPSIPSLSGPGPIPTPPNSIFAIIISSLGISIPLGA